MSDKLDALRALLARVEAGDHRVGMWRALINPLHPHAPEYARQAFLGSLDAAMALHKAVLPEWGWTLESDGLATVWCGDEDGLDWVQATGSNPGRALLAATLKALIAIEEGNTDNDE